ncbi:leucyl aminopeptidase family protein [Oryzihumus sp.]
MPDLLTPALPDIDVRPGALTDVLVDVDDPDLVLALPVGADAPLPTAGPVAAALAALGQDPAALTAAWEPSTKAGSLTTIPLVPGERGVRTLLLAGTGAGTPQDLRAAGAAVGRAAKARSHLVTTLGSSAGVGAAAAVVEGLVLGGYSTPRWGATEATAPVRLLTFAGRYDEPVLTRSALRCRATMLARNLAVTPSNIKNPAWMAAQARTLGRRHGLEVSVRADADLRREGFGGLLAVGGGSDSPPRLVELTWTPEGAGDDTPHVVLVGKGITFDTGGLDIKPAEAMLAMKTDMSGSAIVLAVLAACRDLEVPVRVTGLLALAENAVSGSSYRPGDVITQYGGRRVEIGNTDAEGRLVMADALAYADAELDPDVLIDIATLTGAATLALGRGMAPLYATDERLERALQAAATATGEALWPFPLVEDYRAAIDSELADVNHIASGKVGGGSITAALFLREFVGGRRWAHLDIAGAGRSDKDSGHLTRGATGFGARLLLTYLEGVR